MNPAAQRTAIAEFCGWKITPPVGRVLMGVREGLSGSVILPDYLNDLNAMHEAEACLDINQRYVFGSRLYEVTDSWNPLTRQGDGWKEIHSTAAQRAEALLRTIGKWTDE